MIYKFTVNNNTGTPILYKIKLSQKQEHELPNLNWPRAGIKGKMDVGETAVVCILNKIKPDAPALVNGANEIEKLNIELAWKINEEKMKQIASDSNQKDSGSGATTSKTSGVRFDESVNVVTDNQGVSSGTQIGGPSGESAIYSDYYADESAATN